ncbi:CBS domain-containing protein [Marinobacterium zhoushanense]|uniref:CBS domain-containing protein n=1 Tax=Marinobacterium zhoushanense TaxID=1679163 RepID=A0ABQ1KKX6_9GAMM|nr:CBS domain-containing protein [Marinobacterium zhoushanense]GGB99357.1 CBS domain-containing protein [Marinobacterium zhoushanense]
MSSHSQLVATDIMSRDLLTAEEHWSLQTLIDFFIRYRITGAPVLCDNKELVGVVSLTDILTFDGKSEHSPGENPMSDYYYSALEGTSVDDLGLKEGNPHLSHRVSEIMTPSIISAPTSTPVMKLAEILCEKGIHRIFITEGKSLCGVVTTLDILRYLTELAAQVQPAPMLSGSRSDAS